MDSLYVFIPNTNGLYKVFWVMTRMQNEDEFTVRDTNEGGVCRYFLNNKYL